MLGFSPVGSRAISAGPFGLVAVVASLSATLGIAFDVSGTAGLRQRMSANIGITFPVSATLVVEQAISATISITFDLEPNLSVAGKPIVLRAVAQSYETTATMSSLVVKAISDSFTIRGGP